VLVVVVQLLVAVVVAVAVLQLENSGLPLIGFWVS
jgi:hypothetical protein